MKTTKSFRTAVAALLIMLTAGLAYGGNENNSNSNLNREKAEFANAGYWIDAVVVRPATEKSDKELLAGKGYYIDSVVVTLNITNSETDNSFIAAREGYIPSAIEASDKTLEASLLDE
jgi:hypothetical protein